MAAKLIAYEEDARMRVLKGVEKLAKAVKVSVEELKGRKLEYSNGCEDWKRSQTRACPEMV